MKNSIGRLFSSIVLGMLSCANAHSAQLDLSDCAVLVGKKSNAAYRSWVTENQKTAEAGDRSAIRLRAIEAINRLSCIEQKLTGNSGWGSTMVSADGTSEMRQPPTIADIRKQPAAWRALNQAVKYSHQAGAFDVGLKGAAADLASRYAQDLPQQLEAAYEDAAAVYEYDCVLKRQFGQRDREAGCAGARSTRASLLPKVSADRRQLLDVSARKWAEQAPRE